MKQPSKAQNFSFYTALLCYFLALCCVGLVAYLSVDMESYDPVVASVGATAVFFVGVGVVLHVIGKVDLPNLKIEKSDNA